MKNNLLIKWATIHSLGVLVYVIIISTLMTNAEKIFEDNIFSGAVFLMVFVLSAVIVGSLIIGKPVFLYIDGKKKEAVNLLLYTIFTLFVLTALMIFSYTVLN